MFNNNFRIRLFKIIIKHIAICLIIILELDCKIKIILILDNLDFIIYMGFFVI